MSWQGIVRLARSEYWLVPVLALAFYVAFIPHLTYPYPIHIDEWVHLACSEGIIRAHSVTFVEPFYGETVLGLSSNLEAGFHVFWAVFQQVSGLSWLTIFRYFPSVMLVITVFSVYVMARRHGFGWEAAFFSALIPTTVGVLGPAFLVPLALALPFIALSLFLVFNFRSYWAYLVLFLFTCFLLLLHAPTAVSLIIILIPYIMLNLRSNPRHSIAITLALVIPFLVPFPWIFGMLLPSAKEALSSQTPIEYIDLPHLLSTYGYFPIGLCILGTLILAIKGGIRNYGLVLGLLIMLLMLVVFYTFHYGLQIMYTRGLTYMALLLSIVAGAGLAEIKNFKIPQIISSRIKAPAFVTHHLGKLVFVALLGLTLATAIPARLNTPYYHMIDTEDYETFVWIKENVNESYNKAILDPWKGTAFTAITGKTIYTRIHIAPTPTDNEVYAFLNNKCGDTTFLRANGISIVYTRQECANPDLKEVRQYVYLLSESEKQ